MWKTMATSSPSPQIAFDKARFDGDKPDPDACTFCRRGLGAEYFRVAGNLACAPCASNASALVPPDTHKAFSRGLLFGAGAAVVGCLGYALFGILTGITLGYAAIGVGWLVGKAMRTGARGLGGRRYQVAAALLTYAAVAIAFIPMALHDIRRTEQGHAREERPVQRADGQRAAHAEQKASEETGKPKGAASSVAVGLLMLLGLGLISPFLMFTGSVGAGLFNVLILFLGMRTAWQLSASGRLLVEGPYGR